MCNPNERHPKRVGKITSSQITVVLNGWHDEINELYADNAANKKSGKAGKVKRHVPAGWSDGAHTYAKELALYRLGYEAEEFDTYATRWGKEWEPMNRESYAMIIKHDIGPEVFIAYNDSVGGSPDGLISVNDTFEAKCLQLTAHLKALETPEAEHVTQCQHHLLITGRRYAHLVYFHPHAPTNNTRRKAWIIEADSGIHQLMIQESERFEKLIVEYVGKYTD